MPTILTLATQHGLTQTIERAISFHPQLQAAREAIWAIPVQYSAQLQTSAGWFRAQPNRISLHPGLVGPKAKREDHVETLLHELAHAFQWIVYGRVDHGATWWEMMHQLGQKPRRQHSIAVCVAAQEGTEMSLQELGL